MVTSIARQSVVIKCLRQKSVLVGNYEFYYLAGLMKNLYGLELSEEMKPQELLDTIQAAIPKLTARNEQEAYLIHLVSFYEVLENQDEQMKELFRWGAEEKDLFSVTTSRTR